MGDRIATYAYDEIVISADCGSFKSHDPHVLRKGFLGIGARKCAGYTHRHFWKLNPLSRGNRYRGLFLFTVDWRCHCGEFQSIDRRGLYSELLGREWIKGY